MKSKYIRLALLVSLSLVMVFTMVHIASNILFDKFILKNKAARISSSILESHSGNPLHSNSVFFYDTTDSFFNNNEISRLEVFDSSYNLIFKRISTSNEAYILESPIHMGYYKGLMVLSIPDTTVIEHGKSIGDSMAREISQLLWNYDTQLIENCCNRFLSDASISRINISDTRHKKIFEKFNRIYIPTEVIHTLHEPISMGDRIIGHLRIDFNNYRQRKAEFLLAVFGLLLTISVTFTFIYYFKKLRPSLAEEQIARLSESLSQTTQDKLKSAIDYINSNFTRSISREGLAAHIGLSPDNLGRYFKRFTGEKIADYINRLRVQHVYSALRDSEESIINLAMEAGFDNISTFNKAFRRVFNTTPTVIRCNNGSSKPATQAAGFNNPPTKGPEHRGGTDIGRAGLTSSS